MSKREGVPDEHIAHTEYVVARAAELIHINKTNYDAALAYEFRNELLGNNEDVGLLARLDAISNAFYPVDPAPLYESVWTRKLREEVTKVFGERADAASRELRKLKRLGEARYFKSLLQTGVDRLGGRSKLSSAVATALDEALNALDL